MGHPTLAAGDVADLPCPFGKVEGLGPDDLRETAYEIFFAACRSSPCFSSSGVRSPAGATAHHRHHSFDGGESPRSPGSPGRGIGVGMAVTSKVKRALGLKMLRRSMSMKKATDSPTATPSSAKAMAHHHGFGFGGTFTPPSPVRLRRPLTSGEIMREQMRVSEQSDSRLRKTVTRILVGQKERRVETIILPLELLRHLKPSDFNTSQEYHIWQKRQLKVLEAGLLLHPSIPLDKASPHSTRLRDLIRASNAKPLDPSKFSESMRALCNSVVSLSWRSHTSDACQWADGYPLNIHIYDALLCSIFDHKDNTLVLDEVDELLELMKKTWSTLGINRQIHNLCFTWVLFRQYVATGMVEADLLCASLAMLNEVWCDVKRGDRELMYMKMLSSMMVSMKSWWEKWLLCYHDSFETGNVGLMEELLPLVFSVTRIMDNVAEVETERREVVVDTAMNTVDHYIRSSLMYAFAKLVENGKINGMTFEEEEVAEALVQLAQETQDLALKESEIFSPILKKWHPIPAGAAAVTLHACFGSLLKQYITGKPLLTDKTVVVLQGAGKLEKALVKMVAEDSDECEDGGKAVLREMTSYEVESIIKNLLTNWIQKRLKRVEECLQRAKETETWNPKSKNEPYAQSCVELMKLAKESVAEFFEIQLDMPQAVVQYLTDGLERLCGAYIEFVALCGSKQSYVPSLPPLTRCNQGSKFSKLWKKARIIKLENTQVNGSNEVLDPMPSTSRGTQRLYVRLNTLHYLLSQLHSLENIETAIQHVSEVAAYRLIFLDSSKVFYDSLYAVDVASARIRPALRSLKQNLNLLQAMVTDEVQPFAVREVMKASFEAFLMVLLAGGGSRTFSRADQEMVNEDFDSLKRAFCASGEGLLGEKEVEMEAEVAEGVLALMGQSTEQLVEDFTIAVCEASGVGIVGSGQNLPMPPTTGRWRRSDPNTILRVLCHRNDQMANQFLKRKFQLAKRR
ncbi:hypothetical protein NMG60_11017531 [Bertholletia excelsa]